MNPFDDPDARYTVLVDGAGRHSLWPARLDVPAGWTVTLPATGRAACLAHIEEHWTEPS
ncbi:MbtH family protein [Kitasatospora sp. HPMI-4]|uniref:MbtH family protein n=1 Tax=Kitasatospora sp. HPMI-4 TaxID=3448443 RepID=UPI003F1DC08B